jgi:hypothetical protein
MRFLTIAIICWLYPAIALCQTRAQPEDIVSNMLASGSVDSHADKVLSRLGDAAAVAVTKVLAGRSSLSASEAESC